MHYINESLFKDEKLVYGDRPHWIVFGPSVMIFILALIVLIYLPEYVLRTPPLWHGLRFHQLAALAVALFGVFSLARAFIFYTTSEYGITDKRVVMKRGLIQRDSVEVFLRRIEGVNISQTMLGRLLGYGTVIIVGTGGTMDYYTGVRGPVRFRSLVQQQLSRLMDKGE